MNATFPRKRGPKLANLSRRPKVDPVTRQQRRSAERRLGKRVWRESRAAKIAARKAERRS